MPTARSPRPSVLLAADSFDETASGIARVARLMARALGRLSAEGAIGLSAIALRAAAAERTAAELGIELGSARGSRARFVARVQAAARTHSHFMYDFTGIARAHAGLPALLRPYLTWIHGIEVWEAAQEKRLARARAADVLLVNSAYTLARARALHAGLDHARICWLATERDEPAMRAPVSEPSALIAARLDEGGGYKGHRELIACWPEVVAAVPGARLRIVGDGPGRGVIAKLAAASPVHRNIDLFGLVPEAELRALLASSSLFAMPSRGEGFGLAYAEAMRHGVPVIASVHDAASEINADGVSGYNVDLDDRAQLPARLIALLSQPALCERMGAAGQARWQAELRYGRFEERFLEHARAFLRL